MRPSQNFTILWDLINFIIGETVWDLINFGHCNIGEISLILPYVIYEHLIYSSHVTEGGGDLKKKQTSLILLNVVLGREKK